MKITEFQNKISNSKTFYSNQLAQVKTGTANASMVEDLKVSAYEGSQLTLKELATISIPSTNLIVVTPWDKSVIPAIDKALKSSSHSFNPVVDGDNIKVPVASLTEETRKNYVKEAKERLEEAKISVRNIRQDSIKSIEEQEENGILSEDEMKSQKEQIEKAIKQVNTELEAMFNVKEKELMTV